MSEERRTATQKARERKLDAQVRELTALVKKQQAQLVALDTAIEAGEEYRRGYEEGHRFGRAEGLAAAWGSPIGDAMKVADRELPVDLEIVPLVTDIRSDSQWFTYNPTDWYVGRGPFPEPRRPNWKKKRRAAR